MNEYTPAPHKKSPRDKAFKAVAWAHYYNRNRTYRLSRNLLNTILGRSNNDMGRWLRDNLLETVDEHYNIKTGKPKTYKISTKGIEFVSRHFGFPNDPEYFIQCYAEQKYGTALDNNLLEYTKKGFRNYTGFQNVKTSVRTKMAAKRGYVHNYDLTSALPTSMIQYARRCGLTAPTPFIDDYVTYTKQIRTRLSCELDIAEEHIKAIINGLFTGAVLNDRSVLFRESLDFSYVKLKELKSNEFIAGLRADIKVMWLAVKNNPKINAYLQLDKQKRLDELEEPKRLRLLTNSMKMEIYMYNERQIMDAIYSRIDKKKQLILDEHDGFRSKTFHDPQWLEAMVLEETGYVVNIKYQHTEMTSF